MSYQDVITLEPGKRGGKPCIRRMRITVADVLGWLANGMTHAEIVGDFPELREEDIRACLAYAADREHKAQSSAKSFSLSSSVEERAGVRGRILGGVSNLTPRRHAAKTLNR